MQQVLERGGEARLKVRRRQGGGNESFRRAKSGKGDETRRDRHAKAALSALVQPNVKSLDTFRNSGKHSDQRLRHPTGSYKYSSLRSSNLIATGMFSYIR